MKYVSHLFNAMLWALSIAIFLFSNTTLQMAFNTGYVFWGGTILFFIILLIAYRKKDHGIGMIGSLVSLAVAFLACITFCGPENLAIVPAEIIREGLFFVPRKLMPLGTVNIVFVLVLVALCALVVYDGIKNPRPYEYDPDPDKAKVEKTSRIARWIAFGVIAIILFITSFIPSVRHAMGYIFGLLSSGDINAVVEYLRQFGPQAALVSASLMVLQSLAAPIPAFIITLSNSVVFGWWQGALLSWSSAMVGAALCFFIARILGRDAVMHFMTGSALKTVDKFFDKFGTHAILICRLLPFMSFDYVSYAAGLTSMGFWEFFIATGIGQAPATIVYSYVGGTLTGGAQMLMVGLLVAFSAAILVFIIYQVFKSRNKDLMEEESETAEGTEAAAAEEAAEAIAAEGAETAAEETGDVVVPEAE